MILKTTIDPTTQRKTYVWTMTEEETLVVANRKILCLVKHNEDIFKLAVLALATAPTVDELNAFITILEQKSGQSLEFVRLVFIDRLNNGPGKASEESMIRACTPSTPPTS